MLIENIFYSLFTSPTYFIKVFPYLKREYFTERHEQTIFSEIKKYYLEYKKQPTPSDVFLLIESNQDITLEDTEQIKSLLKSYKTVDKVSDEDLLIDTTEDWCRERALELAILDSVEILQKKDSNKNKIQELVAAALAIQFNVDIGHDYKNDVSQRLKEYYISQSYIPFDIEALNMAMGGGIRRKAIAVFMAPPKRGKSLFMVHCAASLLRTGKNVLYITCELSEEMIAKRIDANMLGIPMNDINNTMEEDLFKTKFTKALKKTQGNIIIKEFPSGTCTAMQIENLIHELKIKKGFVPDVVVLDYVNICASYTLASSNVSNTNLYVGRIVVEMRALAQKFDIAMLSAVQNNRGSVKKNMDVGMDDLADAFSIAMNVDWGGAIVQTEEMRKERKFIVKTVLTRWDENSDDYYTLGVNYGLMKLLNLSDDEQEMPIVVRDRMRAEVENNIPTDVNDDPPDMLDKIIDVSREIQSTMKKNKSLFVYE